MVTIDFTKIEAFVNRHEKIILQLSAGKDSAACLWLMKPWWHKITVVWGNQGNPYPETLEYMTRICDLVPNFHMVMGEQRDWIARNGYPVDVLPLEATETGKIIASEKGPQLQPFWSCCWANSWQPMANFVKAFGATGVIRGQKLCDSIKAPENSGSTLEGVEYLFPVENWSDKQVVDYLQSRIPESYKRGLTSSLDCMNCTAYSKESKGRIADLKNINIDVYNEVTSVHSYLKEKLNNHLKLLEACDG